MDTKRKNKQMTKNNDKYKKICLEEKRLSNLLFGDTAGFIQGLTDDPKVAETTDSAVVEPKKVAWEDEEDVQIDVRTALEAQHRKLPSGGINAKSNKYTKLLEHKYKSLVGTPAWADLNKKRVDADDEILKSCGFLQSGTQRKETIVFKKLRDLNSRTYSEGPFINGLQFHPTATVGLVSGISGIASLFAVDGKRNNKLHSVKFTRFPIRCARFSVSGNEAIFGSDRHAFVYTFDLEKAESTRRQLPHGVTNMQRFELSPCGKFIAIAGRFGELHLLCAKTKELIVNFKQNDKVRALAFTPDEKTLYSHSETGQVVVYDLNSRRIVHQLYDDGCIQGSAIVVSPTGQYVATGSFEGAVNIYDRRDFSCTAPKPQKTLLNLRTCISTLQFNSTTDILAFGSYNLEGSLRLYNMQDNIVFKNFPGRDPKLMKPISIAFSPGSGYFAVGNNKATALLYRLNNYDTY